VIADAIRYTLNHWDGLPATQRIPSAPWEIPLDVLDTEAVQQGVRQIKERRPKVLQRNQEDGQPRLPSF